MLGAPIRDDSSDSQDLNRLIETLIHRRGLSLPEAMELAVPPIVNDPPVPGGPAWLLHVPAPGDGPFAQGLIALIARHGDEHVFSVDALGLRPWADRAEDAYVFSSEPGVVPIADMTGEPKPLSPGEKVMVRSSATRARLFDHQEMQRAGAQALARAHGRRGVASSRRSRPAAR